MVNENTITFDDEEIMSEQIDEDVEDEMDVLNSGKNDALVFEEVEKKDAARFLITHKGC